MRRNWADRVFEKFITAAVWPIHVTAESPRRWVRVLGFFGYIMWFVPCGMLIMLRGFPFMFLDMFIEEVWK